MRRDIVGALRDIHSTAQHVADDTEGMTFEAFERDRRARQLVERNFEIMGEAVNRVRRREPAIAARLSALNRIVAFRNILIHGYDTIDYHSVWFAVQESLPILRAEVELLLREVDDESESGSPP